MQYKEVGIRSLFRHSFSIMMLMVLLSSPGWSQNLTQTVSGTLVDIDSKSPVVGAQIIIIGTEPIKEALTDENGTFRLENVSLGRITLRLSCYEPQTIPNIEVNSGKETSLVRYG